MATKEKVYNIDSAPKYLPKHDKIVAPSDFAEVTTEEADSLVAGGLWSREKPGGKKK